MSPGQGCRLLLLLIFLLILLPLSPEKLLSRRPGEGAHRGSTEGRGVVPEGGRSPRSAGGQRWAPGVGVQEFSVMLHPEEWARRRNEVSGGGQHFLPLST